VLDRLGATRAGAVYVGDSPVDVAAARNAALPVIAVTYGYSRVPPASLGADLLIDRFDELPGALARLARVP
jgi:phosphoglycolate phosphatase